MRLSVVSAVDDHLLDPTDWVDGLLGQDSAPGTFEVIAVDMHEMDGWRSAFASLGGDERSRPRFVYRRMSGGGRARALNAAIAEATGDVVVFLADDFIPGADFVELHRRFHLDHPEREAVAVGKATIPEDQSGPFVKWLERSGKFFGVPLDEETQWTPDNFFYVGNASVKRSLIDETGPFDEDYPYHCWDDFDYGLRLRENGMRSALIPGATVLHDHPITLSERRRQMHESGQSAAIAERKQPGPHAWLGPGDVPVWRWRAAAWKWRLAHLVTRNDRYRGLYYDRVLQCSYAAGLRQGRRS